MPNLCDYEMRIVGSKESIDRVIACLKADYNYEEGKPTHKHFFRVFDVYDDEDYEDYGNGTFSKFVYGCCAWSVSSCMLSGSFSYYNDVKERDPDIFMGTTLEEQSQDCEIEVFSEETGMCFSEHYIYKYGKCLTDEETEIQCGGYGEDGEPTTEIDWDTYDGDYLTFNDFRTGVGPDEPFDWNI